MKKKTLALVAFAALFAASCLGPNKAFNGVHEWNQDFSENRWANEGVFLVCTIIPVYSIAYLVDIVVLNSIEWWGGENPMDS